MDSIDNTSSWLGKLQESVKKRMQHGSEESQSDYSTHLSGTTLLFG